MPTPIPAGFTLGAIEPQDAMAAFARRGLLKESFRWQDVWQEEHARAFTVAGVLQLDVLKAFQDEIDLSLREGRSLADFAQRIRPQLVKAGFWGDVDVTDPKTGEQRTTTFNDARLRLIYDVNLRQSHAAGRWARIERNKASHPFVMYRTMHDERVRQSHKPWHGLVLPVDDPFWQTHFPPNGWRCRCTAFAVSERDVQKYVAAGEPVKRSAPPAQTVDYVNPHTGQVLPVPRGIDPGFGYNPGRVASAPDLLGQRLAQMEAPLGAAVYRALPAEVIRQRDDAYRQWLRSIASEPQAKSLKPAIGVIDPLDLTWLADNEKPLPKTADFNISSAVINGPKAVRHARQGNALSEQAWEQLPALLREPIAVLYDVQSDNLLYVLPEQDDSRAQVAVEFDYRRKDRLNMVISAYRTQLVDLQARLNNGSLQLVRGGLQ